MAEYASTCLYLPLAAIFTIWSTGVYCQEGAWNSDCSEEALMACSYPTRVEQISFTSKKEELDQLCPDLNTGLRCIDNYTRRCLKPAMRSHFNKLYTGTSMVIQEICHEGPYQKEFLRHAPCLKEMRQSYEVCAKDYQTKIKELTSDPNGAKSETQVAGICCLLHEYLTCAKEIVLKNCGKETASFTEGFLDRMAYSLMETHCEKYTSGSDMCATMNNSSSLRFTSILLPLIFIFNFIIT